MCHGVFRDAGALLQHSRFCHTYQEVVPRPVDPEDGFGSDVCQRLAARNNHERVDSWEVLWEVLFGEDDPVLSSRTSSYLLSTGKDDRRMPSPV